SWAPTPGAIASTSSQPAMKPSVRRVRGRDLTRRTPNANVAAAPGGRPGPAAPDDGPSDLLGRVALELRVRSDALGVGLRPGTQAEHVRGADLGVSQGSARICGTADGAVALDDVEARAFRADLVEEAHEP